MEGNQGPDAGVPLSTKSAGRSVGTKLRNVNAVRGTPDRCLRTPNLPACPIITNAQTFFPKVKNCRSEIRALSSGKIYIFCVKKKTT